MSQCLRRSIRLGARRWHWHVKREWKPQSPSQTPPVGKRLRRSEVRRLRRAAAKASGWGRQGRSTAAQHPAAGPRRRLAAGAAARGPKAVLATACWTARDSMLHHCVSSPQRPLRGWLAGLDGLSLAPAGRSCVPPHSTGRLPLSIFEPRTTNFCGPAHASSGYAACLRRSATRSRLRRW